MKAVKPFEERTDAKLRYARIHLDELRTHEPLSGDDFDRAHEESFLFHLLGARDAFQAELKQVKGRTSAQFIAVKTLAEPWYEKAKALRNHGTHDQGLKRQYHLGGPDHQKVKLKHPDTGLLSEDHLIDEFEAWLQEMETLIATLR